MAKKPKGGKKHRKHGRNARKPGTAERKRLRPDLIRKFNQVLKSSGAEAAQAWVKAKQAKGEPVDKLLKKLLTL